MGASWNADIRSAAMLLTNDPSLPESQTSSTTWKLCTSSLRYPLQVMSSTGVQPLLLERGPPFSPLCSRGPRMHTTLLSSFLSLCCVLHLLPVFAPLSSKQPKRHLFICAVGKDDPRLSKGMSQGHLQKLTSSPPVLWGKSLWGPFLELTETSCLSKVVPSHHGLFHKHSRTTRH